ncbi:AMP-binding protein [Persicimonas caeni]|uniref:AMP-binding protein n=1 Tax=Persicimonas caeni TaxID=2292766 RepID=A0A4Y6PZZ0_PERCE|nr:AMP-binding protein [Persicimonas caeni]QDG53810.1 AMP-binding protein [Persicimonas caeni]QED35031.1 AMP-binding protein [Persicimonas caeni]
MEKLSYVHGTSDTPLLGQTISENLRRAVERWGDREALVVRSQDYRVTYDELWEEVERAAKGLMAMGVEAGERVGIWSPNRYEWVITQFATARIGAILVNINPAYKAAELKYALNQSEVSLLLMSEGFRTTDYREIISRVRDKCETLEEVLVLEDDWGAMLRAAADIGDNALQDREESLQFDEPINIQYTSGTTGFPKGATLSHHNILNNGYFVGEELGYTEEDRICIPVPFYHCFGMVMGNLAAVSHGSCMVVPGPAFDPTSVLETIEAEKCTSLYGVPTMFIAELDDPRFEEFDLSSLRTGIMAGSSCPVEVMKQVQSKMHMPEVTICYGMTETSPVSTQTKRDDPLDKRVSTVGQIHPHVEVKIVNPETGAVVPRGKSGELCTRGYSVMLGYWNNEEGTREALDEAGWMHTGDLATMDAEGYVNIVGRIKDMIIRGGENIYPREIEEFLYTHPDVAEVQVIGVPSEKYGEEVMAWIKPKPARELDDAQMREFCKGEIATYKIPAFWKFVDEFPMTVTGKIQKFKMREESIKELGLEDVATQEMA